MDAEVCQSQKASNKTEGAAQHRGVRLSEDGRQHVRWVCFSSRRVHVRACACMQTCVCRSKTNCTRRYICTYIRTYIHIYIYLHIYIYIYIFVPRRLGSSAALRRGGMPHKAGHPGGYCLYVSSRLHVYTRPYLVYKRGIRAKCQELRHRAREASGCTGHVQRRSVLTLSRGTHTHRSVPCPPPHALPPLPSALPPHPSISIRRAAPAPALTP